MIIVITGSVASGKTSAANIVSKGRYPIFNADKIVKKVYKKKLFIKRAKKKFKIKKSANIKKEIKKLIMTSKIKLGDIEKIVHHLVRKQMNLFLKKRKKYKHIILEIPLFVESKLYKKFDNSIFIDSKRSKRLKRFKKKGGSKSLFNILDKRQINAKIKKKKCTNTVVNNSSLEVLKKRLSNIMRNYD